MMRSSTKHYKKMAGDLLRAANGGILPLDHQQRDVLVRVLTSYSIHPSNKKWMEAVSEQLKKDQS